MTERSSIRSSHPPALLLTACLFCVLLIATLHTIQLTGYPTGDFAANSLLIQDAKRFQLLHGNYSRIGFNHPGPAILYVLATGEWLFHDLLRITTPIGGQLVAVLLYNAAWVSVIFVLLGRTFSSFRLASLATLVFCGTTAYLLPLAFTGLWFPHLYYFPFAAFLSCQPLLMRGCVRVFPALAVSMGFLINGHVSFVSTTFIITAFSIILNYIFSFPLTRLAHFERILSLNYVRVHISTIVSFVCIISIFLMPLLIDSILHFPGEIPKYLQYAKHNTLNSTSAVAHFILRYFGGARPAILALGFIIVTFGLLRWRAQPIAPFILMLIALFVATGATFFYARVGIDDLSYDYVAYFYYSIPVYSVALIAAMLGKLMSKPMHLVAMCLLGSIIAPFGILAVSVAPQYSTSYNDAEIPPLYAKARAIGPDLEFDLDNRKDWGTVWSKTVGLALFARRAKDMFFCVHNNWHISMTPAFRCELRSSKRRRIFVTAAKTDEIKAAQVVAESGGLFFYDVSTSKLEKGVWLQVGERSITYMLTILDGNWSVPEGEFVWSEGRKATLHVQTVGAARTIMLDLGAFTPGNVAQRVSLGVEGGEMTELIISATNPRQIVTVRLPPGNRMSYDINVVTDDAVSPKQVGLSADPRVLGVRLYGIKID